MVSVKPKLFLNKVLKASPQSKALPSSDAFRLFAPGEDFTSYVSAEKNQRPSRNRRYSTCLYTPVQKVGPMSSTISGGNSTKAARPATSCGYKTNASPSPNRRNIRSLQTTNGSATPTPNSTSVPPLSNLRTGNSIILKNSKNFPSKKVSAQAVQQWNTRHRLDNSRLIDLQSEKFFYP